MNRDAQTTRCQVLNESDGGEALVITSSAFRELAQASDLRVVQMEGRALKGFLLAFSAGQALEHFSYQWCLMRFEHFVYWDRTVVASSFRRTGVGRELYMELEQKAAAHSSLLLCHVHDRPANKIGHQFVQSLGFTAIESVMLPSREIVTMYQRSIAIATP